jgi:S-adenosylmethionine-diacylglycerol 3-amino-3-carboxypropyl transferase
METAPETELSYSHTREDPALELALVEELAEELGRPLRVGLVASGGCTALSLLASPLVERVDAVDLNPAQLHLVEMKRCAIERLTVEEQEVLFGGRDADPEVRSALYDIVRFDLPEATRAWWDARPAEIRYGLGRVGRFEQLCQEMADRFAEHGLDPVARPSEAMGHPAWGEIFNSVFDRARMASSFGTASVSYSTGREFSDHFSASIAEALKRTKADSNYFLAHVFPTSDGHTHPCLEPEVQRGVRELGAQRMFLHRGPLLGQLQALSADAPFDLIQTSDVTDWLPVSERLALFRAAKNGLRPGGALLSRRLNADAELAGLVANHLEVDAERSNSFLEQERTFLYREVVVARRR